MCYNFIRMVKFLIGSFLIGTLIVCACAEENKEEFFYPNPTHKANHETVYSYCKISDKSFPSFELLNNELPKNTSSDKEKDKQTLREEWKDFLHGLDIFYPYFKAKELEDWIGEKIKIEFLNLKGKPKIEEDEIFYIFRMKM